MFILPTLENAKIKRIPWATIFIIVCCCWVFLFVQKDDNRNLENIIIKYGQNGLFDIEAEAFSAYRKKVLNDKVAALPDRGNIKELPNKDEESLYDAWLLYYGKIWSVLFYDMDFQNGLKNRILISQESPKYDEWLSLRLQFEADMTTVVSLHYAFKTAWPNWITAFTSLFLHGDLYHLLGNMVFLFIVGTVLEAVIGPWIFIFVFLFIGVLESWLTVLLIGPSAIGSIGASGAISGVMGTYSVLLGRTMIPAFVSFGFYFTNMRVPAIALIVFWALKELLYNTIYPASQVNYMAHFSGFVLGGTISIPLKLWRGEEGKALFDKQDEKTEQNVGKLVSSSVKHLQNLEPEQARKCIATALWLKPDDVFLLDHLFGIDKQLPDKQVFKRTANKLFTLMIKDPQTDQLLYRRYHEYKHIAGLDLPEELLARLVRWFGGNDYAAELIEIVRHLQQNSSQYDKTPGLTLYACRFLLKKKMIKDAVQSAKFLICSYPDSEEAKTIRSLFNAMKKKQDVS